MIVNTRWVSQTDGFRRKACDRSKRNDVGVRKMRRKSGELGA